MKKVLVLALALMAPLLADNYIAITVTPTGDTDTITTYQYTIYLTIPLPNNDVVTIIKDGSIEACCGATTTTIPIYTTPTLQFPQILEGTIKITAIGGSNTTTSSVPFTMVLNPDETNTASFHIDLGDFGEIDLAVIMYVAKLAKLSISGVALAAVALSGLLGLKKRKK